MNYLKHLMIIIFVISITSAQEKRAMEIEDMFRIKRVSDPQISPDGKWIAFVVTEVIKNENKMNSDIYLIPSCGGEVRRLTTSSAADNNPRWSPDGKNLAFVSTRSGTPQIWLINPFGGEAKQLTDIYTGASQPVWSPDGKSIAFVSSVYPEFSEKSFQEANELNKKKDEERSKTNARIINKLLYRHWNSWVEDKRQHIFIISLENKEIKNLTPGDRDAVPTSSTFAAGDEFCFSSDGKEIAYTAAPAENEAWNTNHDIFTVSIDGKTRKQITTNPAADGYPRYSKNGKYIAYRAQKTPGFEADKWDLMLYDRTNGIHKNLSENFDSWVLAFQWSPDDSKIFFPAEENANQQIFAYDFKTKKITKIIEGGVNADINISPDGKFLFFTKHTLEMPIEIFSATVEGKNFSKLTSINDSLFGNIYFNRAESIIYKGADDTPIQAWLIKPPFFDSNKKYPLVFLVHGGPQGAWENGWHYRWNPQLWAAQGYVVFAPNPRGSTGFGQKFVNEISGDWGGKVYEDLMKGVDYVEKLNFVDANQMAAAGASYGGYMMNWFATHTDKFKTIITHASIWNFYSMYGTTDEVWFDEWEHSGTPWDNPQAYDKFSPHKYGTNLLKYKTPMLIIHNELDYRVPVTEGMQLFTTLQRMGIESRFLYFPDEGHGVLKPLNSELWHKTVFEWLNKYLKK
ncbi:MAG: Alanyl dipeptidyl peptidase [Ignavibacteriae bacterium]|nr:MAG: Alanyl dipeptidyl peptidase [Ignavibacteriota bacterium]